MKVEEHGERYEHEDFVSWFTSSTANFNVNKEFQKEIGFSFI